MRPEKVTVTSLARELSVSPATISNAYNRPEHVSPELRQRIFDRARQLGFSGPNAAGRSLRVGKASAIGLVFTEELPYAFADPAITNFLEGVSSSLAAAQTSLLIIPSGRVATDVSIVRNALVDGFILYSTPPSDPAVIAATQRHLPMVCVDGPSLEQVPLVGINDRAAAKACAEHLIALGHTRIAIMTADPTAERVSQMKSPKEALTMPAGVTKSRLQGYMDAFRKHSVDAPLVVQAAFNTVESGRESSRLLPEGQQRVTGILATSDLLAIGASRCFSDHGLKVPKDVSIVGFDDLPLLSDVMPTLTTVRQPLRLKGSEAGRILVEAINDPETTQGSTRLAWSLEVRGSTAHPAP